LTAKMSLKFIKEQVKRRKNGVIIIPELKDKNGMK
jgi:hypothetical protein